MKAEVKGVFVGVQEYSSEKGTFRKVEIFDPANYEKISLALARDAVVNASRGDEVNVVADIWQNGYKVGVQVLEVKLARKVVAV